MKALPQRRGPQDTSKAPVQPVQVAKAPRYEPPSILTYDGDKILQEMGPVQGWGKHSDG
ncbi:MAG: hypothetical protein ACE5ID_04240 [Acidobacteriota bacterium]